MNRIQSQGITQLILSRPGRKHDNSGIDKNNSNKPSKQSVEVYNPKNKNNEGSNVDVIVDSQEIGGKDNREVIETIPSKKDKTKRDDGDETVETVTQGRKNKNSNKIKSSEGRDKSTEEIVGESDYYGSLYLSDEGVEHIKYVYKWVGSTWDQGAFKPHDYEQKGYRENYKNKKIDKNPFRS